MNAPNALTERRAAKLTVADFLLLDRSGAFDRYVKTELINGTIVFVNAQFGRHLKTKIRLMRRLADACDQLGRGLEAWSEGSIDMSPDSMPEPDIFITSVTPPDEAIPPNTVVLVAEVADSTLREDLGEKATLYASRGIPEYWVIDVVGRAIHQMWAPDASGYAERGEVKLGERIEAKTIGGLAVETAGLD